MAKELVLINLLVRVMATYCLKNFRVRTGGAQGNQYHFGIVRGLEVLNINFKPNPTKDKFQYFKCRDARWLWSKNCPSLDLAENQDLRPPAPIY